MAIYRLRTFADLVAAVREELGVSASETESIRRIKRDINMVYGELVGEHRWWWLNRSVSLPHQPYYSTGTCAVTAGHSTVTLSTALSGDRRGQRFSVDAWGEIYEIESCDGTTLRLTTPYTGPNVTAGTFKVWNDRVPLPVDCKETIEVWHDHARTPLENVGLQEFRRIRGQAPRAEGKPAVYNTTEFSDPIGASSITGMPALVSRASAGVVKSLVFASSVPSEVVEGARIRVREAGQAGYNGDHTVVAVSTTDTANDTVVFVGSSNEEESSTADTSATVLLLSSPKETRVQRELLLHPALVPTRITLHVDYMRQADDLENDEDEPIVPVEDRIALLYGALHKAWARMRNPEEAARNLSLYQQKVAKMSGKNTDTFDSARLSPSKHYLNAKRWGRGTSTILGPSGPLGSGGPGGAVVRGTADTVATFNSNGDIEGSGTVSTTELGYLNGLSSNAQTQLDALDARLDDAEGDLSTLDGEVTALEAADTQIAQDLADHLADSVDAHEASAIGYDDAATGYGGGVNTVQEAIEATQTYAYNEVQAAATSQATNLNNHIDTGGHPADLISVTAITNLTATDVQAALAELQGDIDSIAADSVAGHVADTTAHPAANIVFTPAGGIAATDVQAAIEELDTEKAAASHTHAAGDITSGQLAVARGGTGQDFSASSGVLKVAAGTVSAAGIDNGDISTVAGIVFSKLQSMTPGAVLVGSVANVPTQMTLSGDVLVSSSGVTSISSGAVVNADVNASAAIAYSKLNLASSIVNADVAAAAAIARNKLATGTAHGVVVNDGSGDMTSVAPGSAGNILTSNGTSWASTAPFADSEVVLDTSNGYGSSGTCTVRFTNNSTTGTDLTYNASSVGGDNITVNTTGVYAIFACMNFAAGNRDMGISRNASATSTSITALSNAQALGLVRSSDQIQSTGALSLVAMLTATDVIRLTTDGGTQGSTPGQSRFRMTRIR